MFPNTSVDWNPKNTSSPFAIAFATAATMQKQSFLNARVLEDDYFSSSEYYQNIIYDDDAIEFIAKSLKITLSDADQYRKAFAKQKWYLKREFRERLVKAKPDWDTEKIDLIYSQL